MTLRPGSEWGRRAPLPPDAVEAPDDAALAALAGRALTAGRRPATVALLGGDLHRTLGGVPGRPGWASGEPTLVEVDLLEVRLDGHRHWAVAHVLAQGRAGWAGHTVAVMNAAFCGPLELGPRAHPGDGLVDVTEGRLPLSDLAPGRRRMRSGSHLPHPDLRHRRVTSVQIVLPRGVMVRVDHLRTGRARALDVEVHPGAVTVAV